MGGTSHPEFSATHARPSPPPSPQGLEPTEACTYTFPLLERDSPCKAPAHGRWETDPTPPPPLAPRVTWLPQCNATPRLRKRWERPGGSFSEVRRRRRWRPPLSETLSAAPEGMRPDKAELREPCCSFQCFPGSTTGDASPRGSPPSPQGTFRGASTKTPGGGWRRRARPVPGETWEGGRWRAYMGDPAEPWCRAQL